MTKFRKFIPVLVCSFLIAGGSVAAVQGINRSLAKEAQATTDCGNVAFSLGSGSTGNGLYLTAAENDLPYDSVNWSITCYPVGNAGGVYLDGVDTGYAVLKKYGPTSYYLALSDAGHALTQSDVDVLLALTGNWYCNYEEEQYTFSVSPEFTKLWSGLGWIDSFDVEEYDVVSLLDSGMSDFMGTAIDTEAGYSYGNLYKNSFPITNNTGSYAFRFGWEALADETGSLTVRIGSNASWVTGHYLQIDANSGWGPNGVVVLGEYLNGTKLQGTGDVNVNLKPGAVHQIEFGMAKIKNSSNYNVFVRYDGFLVKSVSWTLDATPMTTRVGMSYGGTSINVTNSTTQAFGTERLKYEQMHATTGVYFTTSYDLDPEFNSWEEYGLPYVASNISFNGVAKTGPSNINYFKKHSERGFFLDFSSLGISPVEGDVLAIEGSFKFVHLVSGTVEGGDAVYRTLRIAFAKSTFKFNGTNWADYDLDLLEDASLDDLPADSLLRNIGLYNSDQSKCALKNFDQTPESLIYKKFGNSAGYYFTSSASASSEVRFYLPGNDYKAESMGYAIRSVSFDYMLEDANTILGTEAGASLTADGFYFDSAASTTTSYMVQLMDKQSKMYYCFDAPLVADGCLHTFTLNIAYSDVTGIVMKLFKFNGTFFVTNLRFDANEYNTALNSLVYDSLKMYAYRTESGTCTEYYAGAKAAYEALTDTEKGIFNTDTAYGSARARLAAWALANGEVFDPISGTFAANTHGINTTALDKNNVVVISVVICAIALISAAGVMLVIKKRKYNK